MLTKKKEAAFWGIVHQIYPNVNYMRGESPQQVQLMREQDSSLIAAIVSVTPAILKLRCLQNCGLVSLEGFSGTPNSWTPEVPVTPLQSALFCLWVNSPWMKTKATYVGILASTNSLQLTTEQMLEDAGFKRVIRQKNPQHPERGPITAWAFAIRGEYREDSPKEK